MPFISAEWYMYTFMHREKNIFEKANMKCCFFKIKAKVAPKKVEHINGISSLYQLKW